MSDVIWKTIELDPRFEVSNTGKVRRASDKQVLKGTYTQKGDYYRVHLNKFYRVNRLVAIAFIPNPNNLPDVHHKDKNTRNNNVDNLEWITKADNNKSENKNKRKPSVQFTEIERIYILENKGVKVAPVLAKELGKEIDAISKVWCGVGKSNAFVKHVYLSTDPVNKDEFKSK